MPTPLQRWLLLGGVQGLTYYVDATGGNDANSGRSQAQAWQTIAKVNASTFLPGDRILFKRGEAWVGTDLVVGSSGLPGRPIEFDAYGSGALPIIQGATAGNNASVDITGSYITIKNIHALTQPHTTNLTRGFRILAHDIVIDSCVAEGDKTQGGAFNNAKGIEAQGLGTAVYNLTIIYNECYNLMGNGGTGIDVGGAAGVDPGAGATNILIENNTIHDCGPMTWTFQQFGIYLIRANNVLCRKNHCYNIDTDGIQVEYSTNSIVEQNLVHNTGGRGIEIAFQLAGCNLTVRNNIVYTTRDAGIKLDSNNQSTNCYHNTIVNCGYGVGGRHGLMLVAGAKGSVVKNNLMIQDAVVVANVDKTCFYAGNATVLDNSIIDNNCCMFVNRTPIDRAYDITGVHKSFAQWQAAGTVHPDLHGMWADPVVVSSIHTTVDADSAAAQKVLNVASTVGFNPGETVMICMVGVRMEYRVIDTIQAGVSLTFTVNLTYTHTAAQSDSVFSCVWTDFHLQATSPCRGAGVNVGVLTDFDGVTRPDPPTIGAYEYV